MTIRAGGPFPVVRARVDRELVGEPRTRPCGRGMTDRAIPGEAGGDVIRIGRGGVDRLMTRVAVGRRAGESPADVAAHALHFDVGSRERELCGAVIERRRGPSRGVVADRAVLGKAGRPVIRVGRGVETTEMTNGARSAQPRKLSVRVTVGALGRQMRAGEGKAGLRVVEARARPGGGGMANGTVLREAGRRVIRVGRLVVIGQVAGAALRRRSREPIVGMAKEAIELGVRACEQKAGSAVIEDGALPSRR